jgi:hypothetical protein
MTQFSEDFVFSLKHLFAFSAESHRLAFTARGVGNMRMTDPRRLTAFRADYHHVVRTDRTLFLDDTTMGILLCRARMALDDVDTLDNHPRLFGEHLQDFALFSERVAGDYQHCIILVNVHSTILQTLDYFWGQRDNLHVLALAQLTGNRPENACATRFTLGIQQHNGVFIKANKCAILATDFLFRPHYNRT